MGMIITLYVARVAAGRVKVDDHELLRRVSDRLHTKMRGAAGPAARVGMADWNWHLDLIRDERAS